MTAGRHTAARIMAPQELDPRYFSEERLRAVHLLMLETSKAGTACECMACRKLADEVIREASRRGITGLPS